MSRKSLGPRLYLDRARRQWIVRHGRAFIRTGLSEDRKDDAEAALAEYKKNVNFLPEEPPPLGMGYIYFITAFHPDFPIKIGFTAKLDSLRIKALQTGCPFKIYFMGHIRGPVWHENHIHRQFDHLRLEGEWFRNTPELQAYIRDVCAAGDIWGTTGLEAAKALEAK